MARRAPPTQIFCLPRRPRIRRAVLRSPELMGPREKGLRALPIGLSPAARWLAAHKVTRKVTPMEVWRAERQEMLAAVPPMVIPQQIIRMPAAVVAATGEWVDKAEIVGTQIFPAVGTEARRFRPVWVES